MKKKEKEGIWTGGILLGTEVAMWKI